MSDEHEALTFFRDNPSALAVLADSAMAVYYEAAAIVNAALARAAREGRSGYGGNAQFHMGADEWTDEERGFVEEALRCADADDAGHWPTVAGWLACEVRRLRALQPPADLPATLASVDDVRRVCEAAGLVASNVAPGRSWEQGLAYVESAGTGAVSSVVHHEVDGAERWTVEVYRGGPTAVLWHAIQAARSAS